MACPEENGQAVFRFTFGGETVSAIRAEAILDCLSRTLHAINDDLDDKVDSFLSLPIQERLYRPSTPFYEPQIPLQASPDLIAALIAIVSRLQFTWTKVFRPLLPFPPSPPSLLDLGALDLDHKSSFFSLGSDSIAAAEAATLYSQAGLDLTLQDLVNFPILAPKAALVARKVQRSEKEKPRLKLIEDIKYDYG